MGFGAWFQSMEGGRDDVRWGHRRRVGHIHTTSAFNSIDPAPAGPAPAMITPQSTVVAAALMVTVVLAGRYRCRCCSCAGAKGWAVRRGLLLKALLNAPAGTASSPSRATARRAGSCCDMELRCCWGSIAARGGKRVEGEGGDVGY